MKKLIASLLFVCWPVFAAPTLHLGSGLVLLADYRFAEWTAEPITTVQYYQTTVKIDPVYGTGYTEWHVWKPNAFFDVFPAQNSSMSESVWWPIEHYWTAPIVHLPTGNQWVTNSWFNVWPSNYGPNHPEDGLFVQFSLAPYATGDYWIYKNRKGIVLKKGKRPQDFN